MAQTRCLFGTPEAERHIWGMLFEIYVRHKPADVRFYILICNSVICYVCGMSKGSGLNQQLKLGKCRIEVTHVSIYFVGG